MFEVTIPSKKVQLSQKNEIIFNMIKNNNCYYDNIRFKLFPKGTIIKSQFEFDNGIDIIKMNILDMISQGVLNISDGNSYRMVTPTGER